MEIGFDKLSEMMDRTEGLVKLDSTTTTSHIAEMNFPSCFPLSLSSNQ